MLNAYCKPIVLELLKQAQYPGIKAKPTRAWKQGIDGRGVIVAVLDGGIDGTHPDLKNNMYKNFVIAENGDLIEAVQGFKDNAHGTQCAGIIAANGKLKGVAPGCQILGVQIGQNNDVQATDFIRALKKAREHAAKVVNISYSLNGLANDPTVRAELQMSIDSGQLICCGTEMDNGGQLLFPASLALPGMLVVGECNTGRGLYKRSVIEQRVSIYSPGQEKTTTEGGAYVTVSGSSFSTAFVSGTAALIFQACPGLGPLEVARLIIESGIELFIPSENPFSRVIQNMLGTKRRLHASNAVEAAQKICAHRKQTNPDQ